VNNINEGGTFEVESGAKHSEVMNRSTSVGGGGDGEGGEKRNTHNGGRDRNEREKEACILSTCKRHMSCSATSNYGNYNKTQNKWYSRVAVLPIRTPGSSLQAFCIFASVHAVSRPAECSFWLFQPHRQLHGTLVQLGFEACRRQNALLMG